MAQKTRAQSATNRAPVTSKCSGTRKRGESPEEDKELVDDLLSDPKEVAEHLMLLDLGRSGVSETGSVGWYDAVDSSEGHESGNTGDTTIDLVWITLK